MGAHEVGQGWCQLEIPPRGSGFPHGLRFPCHELRISLRHHSGTELILFEDLPKRA